MLVKKIYTVIGRIYRQVIKLEIINLTFKAFTNKFDEIGDKNNNNNRKRYDALKV